MATSSLFFLLFLPLPFLVLILHLILRPRKIKIPIENRHVFITGGSSGIGLSLALKFASRGARVSILGRSKSKLQEAKEEILLATGADVGVFSADVRDPDAVRAAVEEAGEIDVLVVNHGVFVPRELKDEELEEVRFMVEVNLMGTFHVIKAALPGMRGGGGRRRKPRSIAIMSSQAGQVGIYGYTAYCASKFALRGLGEALQQELVEDDIHVSLIFPPDTDTPGFAEELKCRPEISSIIAGSSVSMKSDDVAEKTVSGIESGSFIVSCNFEGLMLSIATAGFSPQRSCLVAFLEVVGASLMRFVALCLLSNWYDIIKKYSTRNKSEKLLSENFKLLS